ncbi:MAG: hypothetical protein ACKO3B_12420, partial [Bacteroidota bacterium]
MLPSLLFLVLAATGASVALRRQFREESWRGVHMAIAALVLTGSGFLVVLSLYSLFDSLEHNQPSQQAELTVFLLFPHLTPDLAGNGPQSVFWQK